MVSIHPNIDTKLAVFSLIAEANLSRRKLKVKCADLNSRFSTQPVTWDEVAEAKKQNSETRSKIVDIRNEILQSKPSSLVKIPRQIRRMKELWSFAYIANYFSIEILLLYMRRNLHAYCQILCSTSVRAIALKFK